MSLLGSINSSLSGLGVAQRSIEVLSSNGANARNPDYVRENAVVTARLGGGVEIAIRDLVTKIAAACDYRGRVVWDTEKPDGQPRRGLDISRATSLLGWTPKKDFDAGLKATVEWWRTHGRC